MQLNTVRVLPVLVVACLPAVLYEYTLLFFACCCNAFLTSRLNTSSSIPLRITDNSPGAKKRAAVTSSRAVVTRVLAAALALLGNS